MKTPNISFTVKHDLCTGCGICEDACPSKAIVTVVKGGRFLPNIDDFLCKNDKGCHRCMDICPGMGINLCKLSKMQYAEAGIKEDRMVGHYLKCFTGHSTDFDIRYHSASGGMVSQFLIFLLENNYIDGAVVTAFDPKNELLVSSYIAHNREEILKAKSSKYSPVSLHGMASAIKESEGNRYVIVGLPCHIEGFRKLEAADSKFKSKVIGYFSLYCSSGRTFYLTEYIFKEHNINKDRLIYFSYRDEGCLGSLVAKQQDGIRVATTSETVLYEKDEVYKERYQSYYHPLRSFFIPRRCLFCIDHYGELADISFGDIHIEPYIKDEVGINSLVVRKQYWLDLLLEAKRHSYITLDEITADKLNSSQKMAYKKKGRNMEFIALNKRLGRIVPEFDVDDISKLPIKTCLNYCQNRMQQFIGRHKSLWWVIAILKKNAGKMK